MNDEHRECEENVAPPLRRRAPAGEPAPRGGIPLNEPVVRYGPFVMNSPGEIRQAMIDYQTGRFGEIEGAA